MGAIVAIVGEVGDPELRERLQKMLVCSPYRGTPELLIEKGLAVGIQRIADDASLARTESHTVAFHGFVGNWPELSLALSMDLGVLTTNAERIVTAYERIGDSLFPALRGEFSMVIHERTNRKLLIVRDPVGLRPLFHEHSANRLLIATEVRQVLAGSGTAPRLDEELMLLRLLGRDQPADRTLYRKVGRCAPSSIHRVAIHGARKIGPPVSYWEPPPDPPYRRANPSVLADELKGLLTQAICRSLPKSPEQYGLALSGGVDSSAIWGLMHNDLYHLGFDPFRCSPYSLLHPGTSHDETHLIKLNLNHAGRDGHLIDTSGFEISHGSDLLPSRINGVYRAGALQQTLLHKAQRHDGVRVMLNGIGGDEWFRGNYPYVVDLVRQGHPLEALRSYLNLRQAGRDARELWRIAIRPGLGRMKSRFFGGQNWQLPPWIGGKPYARASIVERAAVAGHQNTRMSSTWSFQLKCLEFHRSGQTRDPGEQAAAHGMAEFRMPFMDRDLIDFGFRCHGRWLLAENITKSLLRLAVDHALPHEVAWCNHKYIFSEMRALDGFEIADSENLASWRLLKSDLLVSSEVDKIACKAENGDTVAQRLLSRFKDCEWFVRQFYL